MASKKQQPIPATRVALNQAGIREPKSGELKRGKTKAKLSKPKDIRNPEVDSPYRKPPTVRRNKATGKAESRKPVEPTKTVSLPEAGKSEMLPQLGPKAPLEMPRGGLRHQEIIKRENQAPTGKRVERKLRGFASPVKVAALKIWEAMGHIDSLQNHQPGSAEHSKHAESFNSMMPEVAKHTHGGVETILHGVRKVAFGPDYPEKQKHLNMAKDALTETISVARAMERRKAEARRIGNNNGS